jgi:Neuraminidase (sialidase)
VGTEGTSAPANPSNLASISSASDTNSAGVIDNCTLEDNGENEGPRIFSNQSGTACIAYTAKFGNCNPADGGTGDSFLAQCSTDNGATWTAPKVIATPNAQDQVNFFSGAVSKSGNIALTYLDNFGANNEVMIVISKDGGKTFGTPIQYPSASRAAIVAASNTSSPVLAWESDNILWLSQTLNAADAPVLMEDKTCDFGATWSGAVNAGAYEGTSLLSTSTGMVATGWVKGQTSTVTLSLSGN